ncbi:MAG: hypothetical protein NVS3B25_19200 [Hymenobacter sp.]
MNSDTLRPLDNHVLVSLPHRYEQPKGPRSPQGLALTLIEGEDNLRELEAQLKAGGQIHLETATEHSIANLVRVGQVLQIPPALTDQMRLCAAGEQTRTYADITPVVAVGDTVYLDHSCLTDENEILPGIYRVPYAAIICVIRKWTAHCGKLYKPQEFNTLTPVGGYVLLSRVWSSDVVDYEVDDRMQKVRFNAAGTLVAEYNVPPLPNEGTVAWVDAPLKGALNELHPGQRVVFEAKQALVETICGESYIAIRHDYVLGVREPVITAQELADLDDYMSGDPVRQRNSAIKGLQDYLRNTPAEELQADWDAVGEIEGPTLEETLVLKQSRVDGGETQTISYTHQTPHTLTVSADRVGDGEWLKRAGYHLATPAELLGLQQNPFTKDFQRLPLDSGQYDA